MKSFKITAGHYYTGHRITRFVSAETYSIAAMAVSSWFRDGDYAIIGAEEVM